MSMNNGNGNGNGPPPGDLPPEFMPPEDDDDHEDDDGATNGDDGDQSQDVTDFIRAAVRSEMDQHMGAINGKFDQLGNALIQINGAINELAQNQGYVPQTQNAPLQQQEQLPAPAGKPDMGNALNAFLYQILEHPAEVGDGLAHLFTGFAQAKAAMRAPDTDAVLRHIASTEPQRLLAYVPDPLGGRLPDLLVDSIKKGISIRQAAEGGNPRPLSEPSANPSESPPGPSNMPAPSAASSSFADLSDQEIDVAVSGLMQVRMGRS